MSFVLAGRATLVADLPPMSNAAKGWRWKTTYIAASSEPERPTRSFTTVSTELELSLIPRLRPSASASAVLDGVNIALTLMAVVTAQLGRAAIVDLWTAAVAIAVAVLLLRFKEPPPRW
jgi:hypothetical protein